MLISFSHKFIFVHIPKTGGTSIRAALKECHPFGQSVGNGKMKSLSDQFQAKLDAAGIFSHSSLREAPKVLSQEAIDSFYKFAVIRNFWEWVASLYTYIKRFGGHHQHESVKDMRFEAYLDWWFVQDNPRARRSICTSPTRMAGWPSISAAGSKISEKTSVWPVKRSGSRTLRFLT